MRKKEREREREREREQKGREKKKDRTGAKTMDVKSLGFAVQQ